MPEEEAPDQAQALDELLGAAEQQAGGSKMALKPIITLAVSVLVAAAGGLAVVLFVLSPPGEAAQQDAEGEARRKEVEKIAAEVAAQQPQAPDGDRVLYEMKDLIVNVAETDLRRFLKIKLSLELKDREVFNQAQEPPVAVQMTDKLIDILSSKSIQDIDGQDSKLDLKQEIRVELSRILGRPDAVKHVYFVELLVQ